MIMIWAVAPCTFVGRCQHFEETALKMETVCFSETLASTDESTRHQNSEDHHHNILRRKNLNSHKHFCMSFKFSRFSLKSVMLNIQAL
jgi:hypothetical protein